MLDSTSPCTLESCMQYVQFLQYVQYSNSYLSVIFTHFNHTTCKIKKETLIIELWFETKTCIVKSLYFFRG